MVPGDPAVRLPVADVDEKAARPVLELQATSAAASAPAAPPPEDSSAMNFSAGGGEEPEADEPAPEPTPEGRGRQAASGTRGEDEGCQGGLAPPCGAPGDLETLTVSTHVADDPATAEGAALVARTRVCLNSGDVDVYITRDEALIRDGEFLQIHQETVERALEARLQYLKILSKNKRR